jgi:hypothetical protein
MSEAYHHYCLEMLKYLYYEIQMCHYLFQAFGAFLFGMIYRPP